MNNDKVISILNDLVETCRDGQDGFQEAAENATGPDLKRFFVENPSVCEARGDSTNVYFEFVFRRA